MDLTENGNADDIGRYPSFKRAEEGAPQEDDVQPQYKPQITKVRSTGSLFISCHKLLLKVHVKGGNNSLV
jgi:hypothetical protein